MSQYRRFYCWYWRKHCTLRDSNRKRQPHHRPACPGGHDLPVPAVPSAERRKVNSLDTEQTICDGERPCSLSTIDRQYGGSGYRSGRCPGGGCCAKLPTIGPRRMPYLIRLLATDTATPTTGRTRTGGEQACWFVYGLQRNELGGGLCLITYL
jgi:hypothetical protein